MTMSSLSLPEAAQCSGVRPSASRSLRCASLESSARYCFTRPRLPASDETTYRPGTHGAASSPATLWEGTRHLHKGRPARYYTRGGYEEVASNAAGMRRYREQAACSMQHRTASAPLLTSLGNDIERHDEACNGTIRREALACVSQCTYLSVRP